MRTTCCVLATLLAVSFAPTNVLARTDRDPLAGETTVAIWNEATLEAIREASVPAPIAARALAIVNTAMYDAWAAYDSTAIGAQALPKRPIAERTPANVRRAVSIAAFYALRDVSTVPMADVTLAQTGQQLARHDAAEGVGESAARAVLAARHHDGSNQLGDLHPGFYSDYTAYRAVNSVTAVNDASRWQPLLIYNNAGGFTKQHFLVPQWGLVQPFAIDVTALASDYSAPARAGSPEYRVQAEDLISISARLSDEQKAIAEYWADGMMTDSPPGHWIRFGIWVSKRDRHDVAADAKMFFALSNAMLDASILCWRMKRSDDSERPITAIHTLFAGEKIFAWAGPGAGSRWIDGSSWQPYQAPEVVTPAFPEYFSGHSTFSAAAAEVLRRFTRSDAFGATYTQRARTSNVEPGQPRKDVTLSWATFSAAADQAGISRRYGGIHFLAGDFAGRRAGRTVGTLVFERAERLYGGSADVTSAR